MRIPPLLSLVLLVLSLWTTTPAFADDEVGFLDGVWDATSGKILAFTNVAVAPVPMMMQGHAVGVAGWYYNYATSRSDRMDFILTRPDGQVITYTDATRVNRPLVKNTFAGVPDLCGWGTAASTAGWPLGNYTFQAKASVTGTVLPRSYANPPTTVLTFTLVAPPTATITADKTTICVGESTKIHADFEAGDGDTLTGTAIDCPVGTTVFGGPSSNNPARPSRNPAFTPTASGSYRFFARATTTYSNAYWWTLDSVTIEVLPRPTVTIKAQNKAASGAGQIWFRDSGEASVTVEVQP